MDRPTKDCLYDQLALAADEIIRLRGVMLGAADVMKETRDWLAFQRLPAWRKGWLWLCGKFSA